MCFTVTEQLLLAGICSINSLQTPRRKAHPDHSRCASSSRPGGVGQRPERVMLVGGREGPHAAGCQLNVMR
jgi:hypothetical protein